MNDFLKELGFRDEENGTFMKRNRDVSSEEWSESYGSNDIQDMFDAYFKPIIKQIQDKADQLNVKIEIDESLQYGILTVEIL